jgi:hypothetical protein
MLRMSMPNCVVPKYPEVHKNYYNSDKAQTHEDVFQKKNAPFIQLH